MLESLLVQKKLELMKIEDEARLSNAHALSCVYFWDICKLEKNWRGAWCTEFDVNFQILWLLQLHQLWWNVCVLIAMLLAQVWTHHNVLQCMYRFFWTAKYERKSCLNWIMVSLQSVTMFSTDFSFQNLVFWDLFEFSAAEIT